MELYVMKAKSYSFYADSQEYPNYLYIRDGVDIKTLPEKIRNITMNSSSVYKGLVEVKLVLKEKALFMNQGYVVIPPHYFEGDEA